MVIRVLKKIWREIQIRKDPVGYARSIGVQIGRNCHFYGTRPGMWGSDPYLISIGDNVHITNGVTFITHDGGTLLLRDQVPDLELSAPIKIGNNVYIGLNSTILLGVTIGDRCIIGAGSIVTKNIPPNSVAAGVPARVIKSLDQYFEQAKAKSLHFGHLSAKEKEIALKKHFGITA